MLIIKSDSDISKMYKAGQIAGGALDAARRAISPGMSTRQLDKVVHDYIRSKGARPSFLGYGGFPASACISVNHVVIHGIPSHEQKLCEGDIVSVDVGAYFQGFHGDTAATFGVGQVSDRARQLMDVTAQSLAEVTKILRDGVRIGDIGHCVEEYVTRFGYQPVKDFVGHGIGRALHEDPSVPNFGQAGHGIRLPKGSVVAIEPMINEGTFEVDIAADGWTVTTKDKKLSAHFEHTFYIDTDGYRALTLFEG